MKYLNRSFTFSKNLFKGRTNGLNCQHYLSNYVAKEKALNRLENETVGEVSFSDAVNYMKDQRIIYNSFISYFNDIPLRAKKSIYADARELQKNLKYETSIPLCIEKYLQLPEIDNKSEKCDEIQSPKVAKQFPYQKYELFEYQESNELSQEEDICHNPVEPSMKEDIMHRLKAYNEKNVEPFLNYRKFSKYLKTTETFFGDSLLTDLSPVVEEDLHIPLSGSPNKSINSSNVPCGGCGAYLHCQSEGLPGYIPSENMIGKKESELRATTCQRCYFLKNYNIALNVRVAPEVYEKALQPIRRTKALVIVVLDLMDMPCSIWPGLYELIGDKKPLMVVGNKLDLLPPDGPNYMKNIRNALISTVMKSNLRKANIVSYALVSAKTGVGIETLIDSIQINWGGTNGDVLIIGSTNVGKSSLFNAFLGSDLCANNATNLVQRATASPWPGTTLNLLKFPLLKPSGLYIYRRKLRLQEEAMKTQALREQKFKQSTKVLSLIDTVKRTQNITFQKLDDDTIDSFSMSDKFPSIGIGKNDKRFADSKWCCDTPGTVQPDQLLCHMTHEELVKILPKEMIKPRTFYLSPGRSLFIGGLSRMDLLYSSNPIWVTVFASCDLPVTIVRTGDASAFYRDYLGTSLLGAPIGSEERLRRWPPLKPVNVALSGVGRDEASADVVLSSAGFASVTAQHSDEVDLRCWTPSGRGVYLRQPLLPRAVAFKGKRHRRSPAYGPHSLYEHEG